MSCRIFVLVLLVFCCLFTAGTVAQVSPEELQKIEQAAPDEATIALDQPRKLLVFTRAEGFKHDAIPYATRMLEALARKTGAFEVVVGDDMSLFTPESLQRFDGILFNNTTQVKFQDPSQRKALMDFVRGGKGIIGIHAATDNFYDWPEAAEMMGGTFDGHPWTAEGTWKVAIEDPAHPVMAAFEGRGFSIRDEIYRTKTINLRKNYRVLMGLDMKDEQNRNASGVRNSDKDIPISWIGNAGTGRLFYCSLGHNHEVYWNPAVVRHYLDGIQYALGDLSADGNPLPFKSSLFFDQKELDRLLTGVSSYTYGQSRQPMQDLDAFVRYVSDIPDAQATIEQQFLALLRSEATPAGKLFIFSRLGLIGTGASVPALVGMLADSTTREAALYALESLPGEGVNEALLRALPMSQGKAMVGIIGALGRRRVTGAVAALQPFLSGADEELALAAASALGDIGNAPAGDALASARKGTQGAVLGKVLDASLRCAERFAATGDAARGLQIFKELQEAGHAAPVRLAALRGLVLLRPESAGALVVQAMQDPSSFLRSGAMQLVRDVRDVESVRDIAGRISSLPTVSQVQLLAALDEQRDPQVFAVMLQSTGSKQPDVRQAALKSLAKSGNAGAVRTFVQFAARGNAAERRMARDGLIALSGSAIDDSLVAMVPAARAVVKSELIAALAGRKVPSAVPLLLREAQDRDPAVRLESAKALRRLAQPSDIPALIDLLVQAKGEQERKEWETAVVAVARREHDPARRADAIVSAYGSLTEKRARISLLTVAGKIDAPGSLDLLRKALKEKSPDVRLSAIRSLSTWSTPEPADDLWQAAQHATMPTHRAVALRGFVRLLGLESPRSADETVALYQRALALSPNVDERKRLLASVSDARIPAALQFASSQMDVPQLRTEAELVTVRVAENLMGSHKQEVTPQLERVAERSRNSTAVQRANELLTLAREYDDYLTTWEYAGPYVKEGADLLATVFAPEEESAVDVQWRLFPAGRNPEKPWLLEFNKAIGGEHRVVYLRNKVWSDSTRWAILDVGSDDGIKIWGNGDLLLARDAERVVERGDDQADVRLKQGWNSMLVKVTQRTGTWGACIRLRAPEKTPMLQGIRVARVND